MLKALYSWLYQFPLSMEKKIPEKMYFTLIQFAKLGEKGFLKSLMAFLGQSYHAQINPSQLTELAVVLSFGWKRHQ